MKTTCTAIVTFLLAITSTVHADQMINAIRGAKILNPAGTGWLEDRVVQIIDGRIAAIDTAATQPVQPGESTINAAGLMLIPGLIDLHSHLLLHPYNEATWNDQVLKESLELRTIRGVVAARNTLEAGFTMLRDLGTEGAGFADVALRDAIVFARKRVWAFNTHQTIVWRSARRNAFRANHVVARRALALPTTTSQTFIARRAPATAPSRAADLFGLV